MQADPNSLDTERVDEQTLPPPELIQRISVGILSDISLAFYLAWYNVRHRYARSVIGPFWITFQTAIFVVCVGFVFSAISQADVREFMPYFAISFVLWNLLAGSTNNATVELIGAGGFVKDRGLPAYVMFLQCFFRHLLFLAHNIVVPLLLFLILGGVSIWGLVMAIPGLVVFAAVTLCTTLIAGSLATRFRDVQPLIESVVNLAFLVSPIMWKPDLVEGREYILHYNPIVHLLAIWREPLLNHEVPWGSWGISLTILAVLSLIAGYALIQLNRSAFWI